MIGRILGSRYRVEALLGKGAMGAVYRARHVKVGRPFAIKVLHERLLVDPKLRKRFEREAELAGKLHHINVIGVVDVGETEDGIHFMVMEFAEGRTLGSLVEGPLEPARVIRLCQQLCDGLQHAHEHGLIHRDFKPENVIVETDRFGHERPRIVDFGIAILRDDAGDPMNRDRLTTAGLVLGTPHYMAPEHAMGGGIDHRIDLFALGVIMYELLTGWLPFDGDGVDVARANLVAPTPAMGVRVPGLVVDPLLESLTQLLMAKKPADRPESAKRVRHLLDLIERDRPMAARILGVQLTETLPALVIPPAPTAASPVAAAAGMHVPLHRDTPAPFRPSIASTPSTRADTVPEGAHARARGTDPPPTRATAASVNLDPPARRRAVLLAVVGALAIAVVAVVVIATRGREPARGEPPAAVSTAPAPALSPEPPAAVAAPAPAPAPAPPAPRPAAAPPAPRPAAASPPPASSPPSVAAPTTPAPTTPPPAATTPRTSTITPAPSHAQPRKPPPPEAVSDTSAAAVATLYGQVGRELKALDTKRGPEIVQPMWARFRQLRINDALATPETRAAAERLLAQLRRDIAAAQ